MSLDDFNDPAEARRLLEGLGAAGLIGVPVDCGLASPRTLPAIAELIGRDCIAYRERATAAIDIYCLTPGGAALCKAAGITCRDVATEAAAAPMPAAGEICTDRETVETLCAGIMGVIKEHFQDRPPLTPQHVFEVVNALGIAAGVVIAGTAPDHEDVLEILMEYASQQVRLTLAGGGAGTPAAGSERVN
jgi:hypothetical protein